MTVDSKSLSYFNTTNLVVNQPVLKQSRAFYVQYAYYKKYSSLQDFGCGSIWYTIDCSPPP